MSKIKLSTNKVTQQTLTAGAKRDADNLNKAIEATSNFLGRKLTADDIEHLKEAGIYFVDKEYLETAKFKNSPLEFNLDAEGKRIEYDNLMNTLNTISNLSPNISIEDGKAVVTEKDFKEIEDRSSRFTQYPEQVEALNFAEELAEKLNQAIDKKYLNKYSIGKITQSIPIIKTSRNERLTVNKGHISDMAIFLNNR